MARRSDRRQQRRWSLIRIRAWMRIVRLSGGVGDLVEKMGRGGRPAFITLALALVALNFFAWWKVLLAYVALLLLWLAIKATNRVVIDTFEDHAMPGSSPVASKPEASAASDGGLPPDVSSAQAASCVERCTRRAPSSS